MSETVSGVLKKENVAIKYAKIFQDNSLHDYTCNFLGLTHLIIPGMTVSCNILLDCLKLEDHFNKLMQCYSIYFHLELIYPNLVALKKK